MVEVINNTKQIKNLPYGNVTLQPGLNEVDDEKLDRNKGHKGYEYDLKNSNIKIKSKTKDNDDKGVINDKGNIDGEYPKKHSGPWFIISTGKKVIGRENAEVIQSKIDNGEL